MPKQLIIADVSEWSKLSDWIKNHVPLYRIILLSGDLGAGKTTFVKQLMMDLDYEGQVDSPTFSLIQTYNGRPVVHHMDLYRLEAYEDLLEIGVEELLEGEDIIIVEWPELLEDAIEEPYIKIEIRVEPSGTRNVVISTID